jgi:ferrous iron transport protein B
MAAPVEARYAWIHEICAASLRQPDEPALSFSDRLDGWLTHPLWGWLAFLGVMALMFVCIFWIAQVPMDLIDNWKTQLANLVKDTIPEGDLQSCSPIGVRPGVGGVVIFLPQILILFSSSVSWKTVGTWRVRPSSWIG